MSDNQLVPSDERPSNRVELKQYINPQVTKQLLALVGLALAVALGVGLVFWTQKPDYGLLYAGLEDKDAAAVIQALQAANEPYRLGPDGSSILIPQSDIAETKLKLAAQGLPEGKPATGAAAGGNDSPFGMSDMAEHAHFQQQLEADLGNTIQSLKSVKAARVHLALPKSSVFVHDNHEASASVLVTMYPGRTLDQSQVQAIVHLVASSVPALDPKQVSVVDQDGQLLTSNDAPNGTQDADNHLRITTRVENMYAQRLEALLTPLVGDGKVHAEVDADMDFSDNERASETYGKDPILRSEQTSSQTSTAGAQQGQVPGALSNEPPNKVVQPTAANPNQGQTVINGRTQQTSSTSSGPASASSSATKNYELDHTITHVTDNAGRIARLTVAIVVDNQSVTTNGVTKSVPFSATEIDHFTTLSKNAVGFNDQRGDKLSVINEAFHTPPAVDAPPPVPFWQKPDMISLIKYALMLLALAGLVFGVVKPLMKGMMKSISPPARRGADGLNLDAPPVTAHIRGVADEPEDDVVRLTQPTEPQDIYQQKLEKTRAQAHQDPKQMAQIMKTWLGGEDAA